MRWFAAGVLAVIIAFGAGWYIGGNLQQAKSLAKELEIYKTGREREAKAREKYESDIKRTATPTLRVCPPVRPPGGITSGAGSSVDTGDGEDIGPVFKACLDELYRWRALSEQSR